MSSGRVDLRSIPDLGAYLVYKDVLKRWSETGEASPKSRLREGRSGSATKRYIAQLQDAGRVIEVSVYLPHQAYGALPSERFFAEEGLRLLSALSQNRFLREDRRAFRREVRRHRYFVCPRCGYYFNPLLPIVPRVPLMPRTCRCGASMAFVYFKVLGS